VLISCRQVTKVRLHKRPPFVKETSKVAGFLKGTVHAAAITGRMGRVKVLVVEDDASVADGIIDGLTDAAFNVQHSATGAAALADFETFAPDLVLLDLGLPDMDGTDVCRSIRKNSPVPIIVVSARGDEIDRVVSLEMGADDYVVKPFGMRELVARIRAVARRTAPSDVPAGPAERSFGSLSIDTRTQRVSLSGTDIHLTPTEFELLVYLTEDPGAVCRRNDILTDVWDTNWFGTTKTLDAHVAAIRKKLGSPGWIESVRGVGFRFGQPA
jgi:DNA-binding response OmpR family regulator